MKIVFCLLIMVVSLRAQTMPPEPVVVTNRDVFKETAVVLPSKSKKESRRIELRGEVLDASSNVVVLRTFVMKNIYGPVSSNVFPVVENSSNPLHNAPPMRAV